jgi:glutathione S-transferase
MMLSCILLSPSGGKNMAAILYDLAGADPAHRFSPYCWRSKLALAHKRVPVEAVPWRFTEKDALGFSGQDKVPVLVDGDTTIVDSTRIAEYLETRYPDAPSLFGGPAGRALTNFAMAWADTTLHPAIARFVLSDLFETLAEKDRPYFRQSREARFGMPLEAVTADRDERLPAFRQSLTPLRAMLAIQPFLGGAAPLYADYIVFGAFQWARTTSPYELLAEDDLVHAWRDRMLDAFDGLGRQALCHPS